jgi:hypothetical protein
MLDGEFLILSATKVKGKWITPQQADGLLKRDIYFENHRGFQTFSQEKLGASLQEILVI